MAGKLLLEGHHAAALQYGGALPKEYKQAMSHQNLR